MLAGVQCEQQVSIEWLVCPRYYPKAASAVAAAAAARDAKERTDAVAPRAEPQLPCRAAASDQSSPLTELLHNCSTDKFNN